MRAIGRLQSGFLAAGLGALVACASVDVASVPVCAPPESLAPTADPDACAEGELAGYTEVLADRLIDRTSRALVRVELDDAARVRSACVEDMVGTDVWGGRRDVAERLAAGGGPPPGPACAAGRRIDLNRYEAKLAQIEEAGNWCSYVSAYRMQSLQRCAKFASDWILYDRTGSTRPYLYLKREGAAAEPPAADTLRRCSRTEWGFEDHSRCILDAGFELILPPER